MPDTPSRRTKRKDIYVISTAQRPVPLEHYLYAGRDLHKIVDASRNFLTQGYGSPCAHTIVASSDMFCSYKDAGEALRRKQDKEREAQGLPPVQRLGARAAAPQRGQRGGPPGRGGGQRGGTPARGATPARGGASGRTFHQPDKNLYVHLLGNLKKRALLPVVVFTFSKKRCEENAGTLTTQDFSTAVEKSEIHVAVEKALSRLKGPLIDVAKPIAVFLRAWGAAYRDRQTVTANSPDARASLTRHRRSSRWPPAYRERGGVLRDDPPLGSC